VIRAPHLVLAGFFILFVCPLLVLAGYAAAPGWTFPDLIPARFSARSFAYLAGQWREIAWAMASSILYSLATALGAFVLCLAPAKAFARREFRGKALLEGLLLAPALVPSMTFSMGAHFAFIRMGLADTTPGVILILTVFSYPYMLRALTGGYASFSEKYAVCAKNLGAGPLRVALAVELPLLAPAAVAGGSVVFLVAFSEYFLVFLIGGGATPSYSGYLFPFLASSDRSTASILTILFLFAPITLFFAVDALMRRFKRGRFDRM